MDDQIAAYHDRMIDVVGGHRKYLAPIAEEIVKTLIHKDAEYGASWKQRGGTGAFMMLARKWDRLENGLKPMNENGTLSRLGNSLGHDIAPYDVFMAALLDTRSEGITDDIKDLIGYLLLVLAEIKFQQEEVIGARPEKTEFK